MRLEFVRVTHQRLEIAHAVINRASVKQMMKRQGAQRGIPAGAATAYGKTISIRQTALHKITRPRDAILHVGQSPLAIELAPISAAVTRRSAVVHVEHGKPAAGPVLRPEIQRLGRGRGRAAMTQYQ